MPLLPRARSLWNTLRHRERLDRELDEELRAAIETLAAHFERDGLDPPAARRAANRRLGGVERVRDEVRSARIGAGLDAVALDVRQAWRGLRSTRGLAAVLVATLTLGIGATTAIFSVVHAMLLKPLPYRDPGRLTFIWLDRNATNAARSPLGFPRGPMSGPDLRDLRTRTSSFADIAAIWASGTIALTDHGAAEQLRGALVTTNFFDVLGAAPALGRTFRPDDAVEGAEATVLLGWELFERRYGADPSVVGRRISINEHPATVIGVMPRNFRLLLPPDAAVPDRLQAFSPFWPDLEGGPRRNLFLRVVARMNPGVTIERARADVTAMAAHLSRELGFERKFAAEALHADDVREIRGPLLALFGGVAILLTIACVNVAGLLVARAAARRRETALRLALGASRSRLVRQSLAEGLLLTAVGVACGVFAGYVALRLLLACTPASLDRLQASRVDLTVLLFTIVVSAVSGLLLSIAPLAELFRTDPGRALTLARVAAAPVRYGSRALLVTVQVALTVVLLVGAGLLARAFIQVLRIDPGFTADRHLTFRVLIPVPDESAFVAFTSELQRRLAAIRGVTGVGSISHVPYDDLPNWGLPYSLQFPISPDSPGTDARAISPGALEALGVPLVDGRFFTWADRDQKRAVVIVDEVFARHTWPGERAVGRTFYTRVGEGPVTVVGVVPHMKLRSLVDDVMPQIFVPWAIAQRNPTAYVLRTTGDPMAIAAQARTVAAGLDWRMAIYDVRPLAAYVEGARAARRFTVVLATSFAATALLLASVGVYGLIAYTVASRRHEFGVRRALGADAGRLMRSVLREGLAFAIAGATAGVAGALIAGRLLHAQLYAVHPRDPWTFGAALAVALGGSVLACAIPAYRATRVSPMEALRTE